MTASELVVSAGPVLLAFQFFLHIIRNFSWLQIVIIRIGGRSMVSTPCHTLLADNHNLQPTAIFDYVSDIMTSQKYIKGEKRDQACHAKTAFKLAVMRRK